MTHYCGECKQECSVEKKDVSFDHEFGTEVGFAYSSDCCGGDLYDHQCESCEGTGTIEIYENGEDDQCPDCKGKGVTGPSEIDADDDGIDWDERSKDERSDIDPRSVFI